MEAEAMLNEMRELFYNGLSNTQILERIDGLLFPPKKLTWQYSTRTDPDTWVDASDDEYYIGQHMAKYQWRQIEK